ncbi:hypothetical protein [Brachyspira sp.]|uniref:hypothetical protein n=1 Tax=Brachyspira sp. TaxID=1977261 RepID=UPI003D7DCD42
MKNLIILPLLAIFLVACEKSTLKITHPDDNFFLNKLKTLGDDFTVSSDGKNITANGTNYTFEKTISGLGGIYSDGKGGYMVVVPAGESAHTVTMGKDEKETLEEIIDIIGMENSGGIIGALTTKEGFTDKNNISGLTSGLSDDKKQQLEDLIANKKLDEKNLGTYEKFPKTTTT